MNSFDRRHFLAGMGSLAAFSGAQILGQEKPKPAVADPLAFKPDTLFLSWQRDPTTTITIQWIGRTQDVDDPTIRYREHGKQAWSMGPSAVSKPFPAVELPPKPATPGKPATPARSADTKPTVPAIATGPVDLHVFRAELTGLKTKLPGGY